MKYLIVALLTFYLGNVSTFDINSAVQGFFIQQPEFQEQVHHAPDIAGVASWYGHIEQGWPTANGERFDRNAMTAASLDLPFGTVVEVTNLQTFQSVVVRINDRMPKRWKGKRILDLSKAAMAKIGGIQAGVPPVAIRILG